MKRRAYGFIAGVLGSLVVMWVILNAANFLIGTEDIAPIGGCRLRTRWSYLLPARNWGCSFKDWMEEPIE